MFFNERSTPGELTRHRRIIDEEDNGCRGQFSCILLYCFFMFAFCSTFFLFLQDILEKLHKECLGFMIFVIFFFYDFFFRKTGRARCHASAEADMQICTFAQGATAVFQRLPDSVNALTFNRVTVVEQAESQDSSKGLKKRRKKKPFPPFSSALLYVWVLLKMLKKP